MATLTVQFYTEQSPSHTPALTPFFFLSPLRIFKVHPHTHTHALLRLIPHPASCPTPSPRPQSVQRYLSKKTPPPPPYRHPSHPLFHFRIPPSSKPHLLKSHHPRWEAAKTDARWGEWVNRFSVANLGTRIPYHCCNPPPSYIAHSRFHHPGHPSYTITPHPRKLAVEKLWRAGLLVAGGGEEVGGRNWGEGGEEGRIDR